jgi:hypothetical protein
MRGQQINYNEHTEIITAPYYKNTYNEILEDNFSYEINYEQNVSEINGYSTGVLMVTSPYENIKSLRMKSCGSQAKNYNGNTDTGKIEVFSKAMTDEEITTYYNDNVGTYQ